MRKIEHWGEGRVEGAPQPVVIPGLGRVLIAPDNGGEVAGLQGVYVDAYTADGATYWVAYEEES